MSQAERGTVAPWGDRLDDELAHVAGDAGPDLSLVLIGPGPVEVHGPATAALQVERVRAALARWDGQMLFHMFGPGVEYRYDHGTGSRITIGPDGTHAVRRRDLLLLADARRAPGAARFHDVAPGGRVRVLELLADGHVVDYKLEAFV
jgi:hypothetical protein